MKLLLRSSLTAAFALVLPTLAAAQVCGGLIQDTTTFTDGANAPGFSFGNGFDNLPLGDGNPGGYLHNPNVQSFAAILRTEDASYQGDYRAQGVTKISFDYRLNSLDFGNGNGFELSLVLRDTKGTASVDDDDYAYFVGPNVPLVGTGWDHFDFAIPSQTTDAVPAGWSGGWVGDLENFRPGVEFQDVIQSVDKVEIWTLNPAFFAIIQTWNVGADNVSIERADPSWCDVGLGALPGPNGTPTMTGNGLITSGSAIQWQLDNAAPNSAALIVLGLTQINQPALGGILVPDAFFYRVVPTTGLGTASFGGTLMGTVPAGVELFAQYWVVDGTAPQGFTATEAVQSPMIP
ncbi:MAG: hypothetical protein ACI8TQ_001954 [Planctomycetota bacterium]|jgi:hypothetical protein